MRWLRGLGIVESVSELRMQGRNKPFGLVGRREVSEFGTLDHKANRPSSRVDIVLRKRLGPESSETAGPSDA